MQMEQSIARFRVVRDNADDIYFQHIADLHGPFEHHESVQCIACATQWPCSTFRILEDRYFIRAKHYADQREDRRTQ